MEPTKRWLARLKAALLGRPEIILHDSERRLQIIGLAILFGHPLQGFTWNIALGQPDDDMLLRVVSMLLAIPITFRGFQKALPRRALEMYWLVLCFVSLPYTCFFLYRLNHFSDAWMSIMLGVIFTLFQLTDWRLAILGLLGAIGAVYAVTPLTATPTEGYHAVLPGLDHLIMFVASTAVAFGLAVSATNMRRERVRTSLVTIGVMAHEMRTPVAAAGFLVNAIRSSDDLEEIRAAAKKLASICGNMNTIIDNQMFNARLLDLPAERELVDVGEVVAAAVESFPLRGGSPRDLIVTDTTPGLTAVAHREMLRQVIHNLISNAAKAIQAGGRQLTAGDIRVVVRPMRSNRVKIEVQDRGVGIARDRLRLIFEPFQSTSSMPAHGLGLTMCRNSVVSFGGQIWCTSSLGIGTTFHILLPLSTAAWKDVVMDRLRPPGD